MKRGDAAVIQIEDALVDAYTMGYRRYENTNSDADIDFDFAHVTDSANWANVVLPSLRAMAGFSDPSGHGTHTWERPVAVVIPGCEDDNPAEAVLTDSRYVLNSLVDAYESGAIDGATGEGYYPDSAIHLW